MDGNRFCIIKIFDAHECLYEERLCVLQVKVEEGHHGKTKVRCSELCIDKTKQKVFDCKSSTYKLGCFGKIIVTDGGGDQATGVG